MYKYIGSWVVLGIFIAILLTSCGSQAASIEEKEMNNEISRIVDAAISGVESIQYGAINIDDPTRMSGEVIIAGSSTVFPLIERMAERFINEGFTDNITIDSIGSGAGFERFCVTGESDISNASRPINESEIESCLKIGRIPIEFRVGTDALAVVVNIENKFATNLSMEELALVFSTAVTWADVNSEWPSEPIQRFIPGTDSGTFDYFVEEVFNKNEEMILTTTNVQLSEDDNVLIQGVAGSPYGIGFMGFAFYRENKEILNILSIGTIEANLTNVNNNSYPLARPLYIYSDAGIFANKPQVAGFINFLLTFVNDEIIDVGYFPPSAEDLTAASHLLEDALKK